LSLVVFSRLCGNYTERSIFSNAKYSEVHYAAKGSLSHQYWSDSIETLIQLCLLVVQCDCFYNPICWK